MSKNIHQRTSCWNCKTLLIHFFNEPNNCFTVISRYMIIHSKIRHFMIIVLATRFSLNVCTRGPPKSRHILSIIKIYQKIFSPLNFMNGYIRSPWLKYVHVLTIYISWNYTRTSNMIHFWMNHGPSLLFITTCIHSFIHSVHSIWLLIQFVCLLITDKCYNCLNNIFNPLIFTSKIETEFKIFENGK